MSETARKFISLILYWGYGLGIAASFYGGILFFGGHLKQSAKDDLSLWLMGAYETTWTHHFCVLFDAVFGERHLSIRCFLRSSLASIVTVLSLFVLFGPVLGLLNTRTLTTIDLLHALILGAAINVIPDYVSLYETRWLLKRFETVRSFPGQVAVLVADLVITGAITWGAINAWQWVGPGGGRMLSTVELLALFSVYSIFFYSTFLTSVWAWLYCSSLWFMRLFTRSPLKYLLDVEKQPVQTTALVGSGLALLTALILTPAFSGGGQGKAAAFDEFLCRTFPDSTCFHLARWTGDKEQAYSFMEQACASDRNCARDLNRFFGDDGAKAAKVWRKSCDGGYARGCRALGYSYQIGVGVEVDQVKAVALFRQACDGGDAVGCHNLGLMYERGDGVPVDKVKAVASYRRACDGGDATGCANLGLMYANGKGVPVDKVKAGAFFRQACDGGQAEGCNILGWMYEKGEGVPVDKVKAVALYRQACDAGYPVGCGNLGTMYDNGKGVPVDKVKAVALYRQACDAGYPVGCGNLGTMYDNGKGVPVDKVKAANYYRRACQLGHQFSCRAVTDR